MHENSLLLFRKYAEPYFRGDVRVLEIAPDRFPSSYQDAVTSPIRQWDTLDLDNKGAFRMPNTPVTYITSDEYSFPIPDESYAVVLAGNVLEHIRKTWVWMRELVRVTKAGGHVITINPVSWPFHEAPYDCWRAYPDGMRALYEDVGLEVVMSAFESLEHPGYRRYIPGLSPSFMSPKRRLCNRVIGALGLPFERAYDTITIGRKPDTHRTPTDATAA